ncbi:MAG: 30S ribosome-binding factor RbfA [Micromonosporaceae bacterium]
MTDTARVRRHAERIRELVTVALRKQVKDPRVGMVTITDVRLTADLREATVFYTVYGDAAEHEGSAAALDSAKGLLRSVVGKRLGLRQSPSITFVADRIPDQAQHIDELLAKARDADAQVQRIAADARPAGEADPYRAERDDESASDDAEARS